MSGGGITQCIPVGLFPLWLIAVIASVTHQSGALEFNLCFQILSHFYYPSEFVSGLLDSSLYSSENLLFFLNVTSLLNVHTFGVWKGCLFLILWTFVSLWLNVIVHLLVQWLCDVKLFLFKKKLCFCKLFLFFFFEAEFVKGVTFVHPFYTFFRVTHLNF